MKHLRWNARVVSHFPMSFSRCLTILPNLDQESSDQYQYQYHPEEAKEKPKCNELKSEIEN
jgi:hypothetical protein